MSATTSPWVQRLSGVARQPWALIVLLTGLCCVDTWLTAERGVRELVVLPGLALLALLAVRGRRHPVLCGTAAAGVLVVSSVAVDLVGADPYSLGMGTIVPTENAAGVLLVLFAHRRLPPVKALPVTGALVLACLASLYLRGRSSAGNDDQLIAFGFLQLLLAVGTGTYLRGWQVHVARTPLLALLGRQWPMMAGLSVLLFLEVSADFPTSTGEIAVLLGSAVLAALAVIAPLRPVEAVLLGASALVFIAIADRVLGDGYSTATTPLPLTATTAAMLLMAFVTRHADARKAVWSGSLLVAAALFATLFATWGPASEDVEDLLKSLALGGLLLALSVGAGLYFRARDGERTRTVRSAVEQAQQAERLALARELHDVVAHHVTGIVVQAQAAQMVAAQQPEAAAQALDRIANSGTEALVAMRRLVASMRGAEPAGTSGATEQATTDLRADLAALVERAGPQVRSSVELDGDVPQEVARSALRLVQEALTNARKHAPDATQVQVLVRCPQQRLHIRITDDGSRPRTAPVGGSGGYGLVGMRERIELLGGRFSAGPAERTGWRVEAWLPLGERAAG